MGSRNAAETISAILGLHNGWVGFDDGQGCGFEVKECEYSLALCAEDEYFQESSRRLLFKASNFENLKAHSVI